MAGKRLTKEANSGEINGKPVLGSDLIVKGANEERRNHSQESTKIVLHELVHADPSYVLSLVGSKKDSCTLVVKFKMLCVQQPIFEDGIFSCLIYSDIRSLCIISFQRYSPRWTLTAYRAQHVKNIQNTQERDRQLSNSYLRV